MSKEPNNNLMAGAAVIAGIIGAIAALFKRKETHGLREHAKEAAHLIFEHSDCVNKKMLLGGIAGGIIGATAALFLAPKAGSELLKDITQSLKHPEELFSKSGSKPKSSSKKKHSSTKAISKSATPTAKKTLPSRKRAATTAKKTASGVGKEQISDKISGS